MSINTPSKRSPWLYFVLVFVLTIPFWLVGALTGGSLPKGLGINLPLSALAFVCPLGAALILVYREEKREGVKKLVKRLVDLRGFNHKIWYVPTILLMPLILLLSYVVMRLVGLPLPDLRSPGLSILLLFGVYTVAALGEEAGWSGYAIDPLQARWGAAAAGVMLGTVWALWHIVGDAQAHNAPLWIVEQSIFTVAARVVIIWLYNNAGKAVPAAILFHSMVNVSDAVFPNYSLPSAPAFVAAFTLILAGIATFLWGPKTLSQYRFARKRLADAT